MHEHGLAPTTHTIELDQIHAINAALADGRRHVTAGSLGLGSTVAGDSLLLALDTEGSPSYPYVYALFCRRPTDDVTRVELHTAQLRAISHALSLRAHVWGV